MTTATMKEVDTVGGAEKTVTGSGEVIDLSNAKDLYDDDALLEEIDADGNIIVGEGSDDENEG